MKKLFCIIGLTGAGKTTYLNYICKKDKVDNIEVMKKLNKLVYCTTRTIRENEKEGKDYYFYTIEEYNEIKNNTPEDILEERFYNTKNNGGVYYFTLKENLVEDYYICSPSIEQLESYKNLFGPDKLSVIEIKTDLKVRFNRTANMRCKNDADLYELCRRILQEKEDWKIYDRVMDGIMSHISIDNSNESWFVSNYANIIKYIAQQITDTEAN